MQGIALFMYLFANILIGTVTIYFFWKVLTTPPSADGHEEDVPVRKTFDAT